MKDKIEIMEVLKRLAEEHKRHVTEIRHLEEMSNIIMCGINDNEVHIYEGLIGMGLPLECEEFNFTDAKL